jgi:hypothetical protein
MKFIWEEEDLKNESKWGLMATRSEEIVIIGGKRLTSLRDGHSWEYASYKDMAEELNKQKYVPVLAPVNPSVVIRQAEKKHFNYGGGFDS